MERTVKLCVIICLFLKSGQAVLQFTQEPSDQAVLLEQSLWWHCVARASIGSQDPTYTWLFGGQPLQPGGDEQRSVFTNGTLYIPSISQAVLGRYRCRVQSGVLTLESGDVQLALASLGIVFQTSPASVTQNLGSSLTLQCSISSIPIATVTWQLNGEDVSPTVDSVQTTESGSVTTSVLHIESLDHRHGGQYRCLATNRLLTGLARYSQLGEVTLIGRPGFSVTPDPITVILGRTATFLCEANGSPASTIDWLSPENSVITTGGRFTATATRLTITNTQQSDEGYYTCRATNAWGENTATSLLTVSDPSRQIVFTTTPTDQSEVVGGRVTFPCAASGNPAPTLTWSKEDGDLPAGRIQEPALGWLRIVSLQASDAGFYVCTATNALTSAATRVQLIVQVTPSFSEHLANMIVESGDRVQFDCIAEGVPTPAIKWTTPLPELGALAPSSGLQFGVEVLSNGSLVVVSAENRHAGVYSCQASNSVSSATTSASLTVRSAPVITSSPNDQRVIEGETATFECRAVATPQPAISWLFDGQQLVTDLQFEVLGNGDLRINNVEKSLEGVYTCRAENSLGTRDVSAYLTVHVPPQFITHPTDQVVDPGSRVTLDCEASGDPTPTLQWQKDGSPLILETNIEVLSNSTIIIDNLTELNTGDYTCFATNIAGTNQVTASVLTPDIPKFIGAPSNTTSNESYTAVITCRTSARESPTVSWYLSDPAGNRGDQIGLGRNLPMSRAYQSFVSLTGDLEIGMVSRRDEGWYLCVAENSVGSISGAAYLTVNFPPRVTGTNSPVHASGGSGFALLSCGFEGQPIPSVGWSLPDGRPVTDDPQLYSKSVQIDSAFLVVYNPVVDDHDGEFMCTVSNFLGSANASVQLSVEGTPVLTSARAIPDNSGGVTLSCTTKGSPQPVVTWRRDTVLLPDASIPGHTVLSDGSLVITDVAAAEVGVYTCTATNTYGSALGTLQVPGQPARPVIDTIRATSLGISWTPPTPLGDLSVTGYTVQSQAQEDDDYSLAGQTGDLFFEIEGLKPYTGYRLRVQAVNGLGAGPFSVPTSLIFTAAAAPSRPRNVEAVSTGNFVTVTWSAPSSLSGNPVNVFFQPPNSRACKCGTLPLNQTCLSADIEYELEYHIVGQEDTQSSSSTVSHNANQLMAVVEDLEYEADYEFRIRAGNSALQEWSRFVTVEVRTGFRAPASPISGFDAVGNGTSSIWLTWEPTNDSTFQAYLIYYRTLNSTDGSPDIVLTVQRTSYYVIVGLARGTQYAVSMAYQNAGGLSPVTAERVVTTLAEVPSAGKSTSRAVSGGIIAAIVCGLLVVILILALVAFAIHWKRKNDDWTGQPSTSPFNVDSLWINRRFSYGDSISVPSTLDDDSGSQKGVYDVSVVNDNYAAADETGLSSDSAYDLGGGGVGGGGESKSRMEGSTVEPMRPVGSEGEEKKRKKRRWRGFSDVIYKNPDNPGVVLVSKAIIGDSYPAPGPVPVKKDEVLTEDEADVSIPSPLSMPDDSTFQSPDSTFMTSHTANATENPYVEIDGTPLSPQNDSVNQRSRSENSTNGLPSPEFPVFPNANDGVRLSEELHVDPRLMRKMERRAERDQEKKARKKEKEVERDRQKEREREERERERMFGRKRSLGVGGLKKLFKRGSSDEIPYPENNFIASTDRQVENAGMF